MFITFSQTFAYSTGVFPLISAYFHVLLSISTYLKIGFYTVYYTVRLE